jgi:hypothetical protein
MEKESLEGTREWLNELRHKRFQQSQVKYENWQIEARWQKYVNNKFLKAMRLTTKPKTASTGLRYYMSKGLLVLEFPFYCSVYFSALQIRRQIQSEIRKWQQQKN